MNEQNNKQDKRLTAITVTGLILVFAPVSSVIITLMYSFFRNIEKRVQPAIGLTSDIVIHSGIEADTFFTAAAITFALGLIVLSWVVFRKVAGKAHDEQAALPPERE